MSTNLCLTVKTQLDNMMQLMWLSESGKLLIKKIGMTERQMCFLNKEFDWREELY